MTPKEHALCDTLELIKVEIAKTYDNDKAQVIGSEDRAALACCVTLEALQRCLKLGKLPMMTAAVLEIQIGLDGQLGYAWSPEAKTKARTQSFKELEAIDMLPSAYHVLGEDTQPEDEWPEEINDAN